MQKSLLNSNEYTDGNSLSYLLFQYRLSHKYSQNLISTAVDRE